MNCSANIRINSEVITINTQILGEDEKSIKTAAQILRNGGLVAFPTETVYGLGADASNESAVKKIFKAKGRPSDNPLIVHISTQEMLPEIVSNVPDCAKILMDAFMPGPITLIMNKNPRVGNAVTAGLNTVAVRFPSHDTARRLISEAGVPIAAPSANLSGKPSPTIARHVISDLNGRVDAIISGGECSAGVESTVVDCTGEHPVILRPGIITHDDIKEYIPKIQTDKNVLTALKEGEAPKCPGMKYRHYAPDAEVTVVEGEPIKVISAIKKLISENSGKKIGVLSCTGEKYEGAFTLHTGNGNAGYAHSLFTLLRRFDEEGVDIIFAEFCINDKYSVSVKNRLYKSAGNKIIYV